MSATCTQKEAARRRSRLYSLLVLSLPEALMVEFLTSPKPPSEAELIRCVKRTARESLRCARCGGSWLDTGVDDRAASSAAIKRGNT